VTNFSIRIQQTFLLKIMFKCRWSNCDAQPFETEAESYDHLFTYHKPTKNNRACLWRAHVSKPICGFHIRSTSHHPDHIISHFSVALRPIPCAFEGCEHKFRNRQERKKHTDIYHKEGVTPPQPAEKQTCSTIVASNQQGVALQFFKRYVEQLDKKCVKIPVHVRQNMDSCIAQGTRIPAIVNSKLHDSIINTSMMSLQDYVSLRNRLFFDEIKEFAPMVHQIVGACIGDPSDQSPANLKVISMALLKDCWTYFQEYVSNEDRAELVELSDQNSSYYRTIGLKVSIMMQPDYFSLAIQKNMYSNALHLFQNHATNLFLTMNLAAIFFSFNLNEDLDSGDFTSDMYLCLRLARSKQDLDIGKIDTSVADSIISLGFPL